MDYRYEKSICECESVSELTFLMNDSTETGLASVYFTVKQEMIVTRAKTSGTTEIPSFREARGILHPKDGESAHKLLKQFDSGGPLTIKGRFKDRLSGHVSDFALHGVLFSQVDFSSGWSFHANFVERL